MLLETIVEMVKDNPEEFVKPTSSKFYSNVFEECDRISSFGYSSVKNKMRNLKDTFIRASTWQKQTGDGLLKSGKARTVKEHILKICPFWELLEQIFGGRKSVNQI